MEILKEYSDSKGETEINWYYPEEDTDAIEEIEDMAIETGLEITCIPK